MPSPAFRLENLPPYVFAVIGDQIKSMQSQGIDVIRLDIGSPDMPPPMDIIHCLGESATDSSVHGYSGYRGTPVFRQAVANYYHERFSVQVSPDTEVLPLLGSKEGIVNLSLAFLDHGDIVLIPDIGYPSYAMGARLAGADIHWLPMRSENGFKADYSAIPEDILSKAKMMWVSYPNNPTGAVVDLEYYERLVEFCAEHDILLVSDNPYVDVTFEGYNAPSALEVLNAKSTMIEFMSLSKTYNMAGWRLGAAVGSVKAIAKLLVVKSNVDSGHFKPVYSAGAAALNTVSSEWLAERNAIYCERRDMILEALPEMGMSAEKPKATLYIWAKIPHKNSEAYTQQVLNEAHVSIAPGAAYGPGGEGYVRFSLGVPKSRLREALERLKAWHKNR